MVEIDKKEKVDGLRLGTQTDWRGERVEDRETDRLGRVNEFRQTGKSVRKNDSQMDGPRGTSGRQQTEGRLEEENRKLNR